MDKKIIVRQDRTDYIVHIDKISHIKACKDYVRIFTPERSYLHQTTMDDILKELSNHGFSRVHKSFIVNKNKVVQMRGNTVKVASGEEILSINLGFFYRQKFKESLLIENGIF